MGGDGNFGEAYNSCDQGIIFADTRTFSLNLYAILMIAHYDGIYDEALKDHIGNLMPKQLNMAESSYASSCQSWVRKVVKQTIYCGRDSFADIPTYDGSGQPVVTHIFAFDGNSWLHTAGSKAVNATLGTLVFIDEMRTSAMFQPMIKKLRNADEDGTEYTFFVGHTRAAVRQHRKVTESKSENSVIRTCLYSCTQYPIKRVWFGNAQIIGGEEPLHIIVERLINAKYESFDCFARIIDSVNYQKSVQMERIRVQEMTEETLRNFLGWKEDMKVSEVNSGLTHLFDRVQYSKGKRKNKFFCGAMTYTQDIECHPVIYTKIKKKNIKKGQKKFAELIESVYAGDDDPDIHGLDDEDYVNRFMDEWDSKMKWGKKSKVYSTLNVGTNNIRRKVFKTYLLQRRVYKKGYKKMVNKKYYQVSNDITLDQHSNTFKHRMWLLSNKKKCRA